MLAGVIGARAPLLVEMYEGRHLSDRAVKKTVKRASRA